MPPTSEPSGPTDVVVLIDGLDSAGLGDLAPRVEGAAAAALAEARAARNLPPDEAAEVSVTFVGDDEIAALNHEWLAREGPTDVIAFGLGGSPLVGDVYVSLDTARRQADELGLALDEEVLRLVVHGVLHVAGWDHPDGEEREASEMYVLQERVLAAILGDRLRN
ncbi:MAG: rRNA maturation RNase YbeY [Gemmatimonadota bacterium]